jgi:succinate dehydrogenase / fumarate reductase cytochrome b subunit
LTSLVLTLTETLRYRGAIGQWSWVLHRITGLGVVFFLVLHVIGVSWSVFYPELWEKEIAVYQHPLFTIGEFVLTACVVYHALNGLRISIFDNRPQLWKHQARAAMVVLFGTVVLLVPTYILMFGHAAKHFGDPDVSIIPFQMLIESVLPFGVGIVAAIIVAVLASGLYGLIGGNDPQAANIGKGKGSRLERFWWSYMRVSGLLIVPLVFGHLAIAHIVQGVFDLTVAGAPVAGVPINEALSVLTNGINETGTAVEYVAERWNFLMGSIAVWRVYDAALLILVTVHGFNGLRYVLTDYTMASPVLRRAAVYLCAMGAVALLVVGVLALLGTIDQTAVDLAVGTQAKLMGG